ncbi:MAG TPA: hypothetical protein VH109_11275 [Steroidobacteraceae bacterium]|jgi:hypothetical protein|nr:hypothetical protein [Steroidobacteraceae bacterium]
MSLRPKAFGVHLLGSALALSLVFGFLYFGWYRWPGWYLADALHVAALVIAVDLALGPLITLVIANPRKPRRELTRDIAMVVAVQLAALVYGGLTLWHGRPLYYTFSQDRLEMVQASDLDDQEVQLARRLNPDLAPHWYSRPRWIWAPLPDDKDEAEKIVAGAVMGEKDVIQMPRYFKSWQDGRHALDQQLHRIDDLKAFTPTENQVLKSKLTHLGVSPDRPDGLPMWGRGRPLLALVDPATGRVSTILMAK